MEVSTEREDLSAQITAALEEAIRKLIAETKAKNSYLVIAEKDGTIKKIPASEL